MKTNRAVGQSKKTEAFASRKATRHELHEFTKHVSIRESHPNMYKLLMIIAFMFIALAINLYFSKPTFRPYGLQKEVIATVYLFLGVGKIVFLNLYHNLKMVRLIMAIATAFMLFWGLSNTQQSLAGKASFQLPILFVTLALLNLALLLEPSSNPMTGNDKDSEQE